MGKSIEEYMKLPYTIELRNDAEDGWFVRVKELPGCMSQGDSAEEALAMIQEAMQDWIEVALEDGKPIPEPVEEDEYSGKFIVRTPRWLHRRLVKEAEAQGISLNQYVSTALAYMVGGQMVSPAETQPKKRGQYQVRPSLSAEVADSE